MGAPLRLVPVHGRLDVLLDGILHQVEHLLYPRLAQKGGGGFEGLDCLDRVA